MTPDNSAVRKAQTEHAVLVRQVETALAKDPAFQVMAVDGLAWICPYTGQAVQTPFGGQEEAKAWLMQHQPWKTRKVMPPAEVQRQRWRLWLREHLEGDGRLRLFGADNRWLNPFTAHWERLDFKPGDPPASFVECVATRLAACREAQSGQILARDRLDAVLYERSQGGSQMRAEAVPEAPRQSTGAVAKTRQPDAVPHLAGDEGAALQRSVERMLPVLPQVAGVALAVHHEPAHAGGNDFYVAGKLADSRLFLALGTVRGSGTPNALAVPVALRVAMATLPETRSPLEVLRRVAATMRQMLAGGQSVGMHALIYDPGTRNCLTICAGLPTAVRLNLARREVLTRIGEAGPALITVAEADLAHEVRGVQFTCEPGDTIALWSDGLPQAADLSHQAFGEPRAMAVLVGQAGLILDDLLAAVANTARDWTRDSFRQDVTILGLRVLP